MATMPTLYDALGFHWPPLQRVNSAMRTLYDTIGINYGELRKPDPRIARIIKRALGSAQTILNVGAGTGSYEPAGRSVTAVEPSAEMIRKRVPGAQKAIPVRIIPVLVPHDCSDGFLYAYLRRPAAYLDPYIRSGSSSFWTLVNTEAGLKNLKQDLENGEWERRYAELLTRDEYDAGYRLIVSQ